jgi:hypothetical protein
METKERPGARHATYFAIFVVDISAYVRIYAFNQLAGLKIKQPQQRKCEVDRSTLEQGEKKPTVVFFVLQK